MIRLDKYLADMGISTRNEVKKIIKSGQIKVNKEVELDPSRKIIEETDQVSYKETPITYVKHIYYMFHKPAGCVTAAKDSTHQTVMDYFKNIPLKGLFPVGRLDLDTEGLLLITNDGALAHNLLSPVKHVKKTYYAKILGTVLKEHVKLFQEGLEIGEKRKTLPAVLRIISNSDDGQSEIELTISEGKYHQVKRMFESVGMKVTYLKRISMGGLWLDPELKLGNYRILTDEEVLLLRFCTGN